MINFLSRFPILNFTVHRIKLRRYNVTSYFFADKKDDDDKLMKGVGVGPGGSKASREEAYFKKMLKDQLKDLKKDSKQLKSHLQDLQVEKALEPDKDVNDMLKDTKKLKDLLKKQKSKDEK